jgi:hypothetical protein
MPSFRKMGNNLETYKKNLLKTWITISKIRFTPKGY